MGEPWPNRTTNSDRTIWTPGGPGTSIYEVRLLPILSSNAFNYRVDLLAGGADPRIRLLSGSACMSGQISHRTSYPDGMRLDDMIKGFNYWCTDDPVLYDAQINCIMTQLTYSCKKLTVHRLLLSVRGHYPNSLYLFFPIFFFNFKIQRLDFF